MNNEEGYERGGARRRIASKRFPEHKSSHQPTAATAYYAHQGDEQSTDLIRSMYDPAPSIASQTMSPDASG